MTEPPSPFLLHPFDLPSMTPTATATAPSASAASITMAVVVTGSVSDFTTAVRLELCSAVASEAGVEVSAVRLDVSSTWRPWRGCASCAGSCRAAQSR